MITANASHEQLSLADRDVLFAASEHVNQIIDDNGYVGWQQLDTIVPVIAGDLDFPRIVAACDVPETYHRIPFPLRGQPCCLVLFVFKSPDKRSAVVLLHTYACRQPNKTVYPIPDDALALHPAGHFTAPHDHNTLCHSCIAWTNGRVSVTEQLYQKQEANTLELLHEIPRPVNDCRLDDSNGACIHSICVDFTAKLISP